MCPCGNGTLATKRGVTTGDPLPAGMLHSESKADNSRVGSRPRLSPVALLVVAATAATGGCSTDGDALDTPSASTTRTVATPTATVSTTTAGLTVPGDECVNSTGYAYAQRGDLSAGPFTKDVLLMPPQRTEAKLWVASQRAGQDDASLTIVDPTGKTERQIRKSGDAIVVGTPQFYPGIIRVGPAGAYRIDVRVGPDHLCVLVDYSRPTG